MDIKRINNIIFSNSQQNENADLFIMPLEKQMIDNVYLCDFYIPVQSIIYDLNTQRHILRCFDECINMAGNWLSEENGSLLIRWIIRRYFMTRRLLVGNICRIEWNCTDLKICQEWNCFCGI